MFGRMAIKKPSFKFSMFLIFFLDIAHFRQNVKNFHLFRSCHNIWPRKSSNIINILDDFYTNNIQSKMQKLIIAI